MMILLAVIVGFGLLISVVMATLIAIGKFRRVREIAILDDSLIYEKAYRADFTDSFQIAVPPDRFANLDALIQVAFQKGDLVDKNDHEILYRDVASGLRFYVSYSLRNGTEASVVTMSTSVHYTNSKGRIYFAFVRPFHHMLLPFAISQMVQMGASALDTGQIGTTTQERWK